MKSALVIISHYNAWPTDQLVALLDQMRDIPAGHPHRCLIVVNRAVDRPLELPARHSGHEILYRENIGYNIGAWEYGWRAAPPAEYYLFLQEECQIVSPDWLGAFTRQLARPKIGLVGEIMAWAGLSWRRTEYYNVGQPYLVPPGEPPMDYMEGLKAFLKAREIPPGRTSEHLQSLILATRRDVLEAIDGFMIGRSKGDAVSCEVAISLLTVAKGFEVRQVGRIPFRYIRHPQWLDLDKGSFTPLINFIDRYVPLSMTRVVRNAAYRLRPIVTGRPNPWDPPKGREADPATSTGGPGGG